VTRIAAACLLLAVPSLAAAQHEAHALPPAAGWAWRVDAQAFLNANLQVRKFRDFYGVESQNWTMATAGRSVGRGRLTFHGMLSFEEWTLPRYGSPQVFQTGETFDGAALTDYQHPHDLVMAAGARLEWPSASWRLIVAGGPVASPAIGPEAFMHRASAGPNPTAPLGHHALDATHVTHGVVTIGAGRGAWTFEASTFHGREPDEDRVAVEFGPLDSYSARLSWQRGPWRAQVSGGRLKFPNPTEFTDEVLVTGSVSYTGAIRAKRLALTVACGVARESAIGVTAPACLAEAASQWAPRDEVYGRLEILRKDILTQGGYDPPGFEHLHVLSTIAALTIGYERRVFQGRAGRIGAGADFTLYLRDRNLADSYGRPVSAHVFLRYRFAQLPR
jgi:hypothetical protein